MVNAIKRAFTWLGSRARRIIVWILCCFGMAAILILVAALSVSRFHFYSLLGHSWIAFTSSQSSNTLGWLSSTVIVPILTVGITVILIRRSRGKDAMMSHWRDDALITLRVLVFVLVLYYVPLFILKGVVATVYEDHQTLVAVNSKLKQENAGLTIAANSTCQKEKGEASDAKAKAQQANDDSRHWQEAYERYSHHEQFPDRHLDREDRRRLREEFERVAKEPSNREYIKLDFGVVNNIEAQHVGFQLYQLFRDSRWNISKPRELPKDLQDQMQSEGGANASGMFIFTDNPDRGRYLSMILGRISQQEVIVNPRGIPQHYKGLMLWVGNKHFTFWKDDD
jgi:hypothetical protein